MSSLTIASLFLALAVYIPLCIEIILGKAKQNIATWILWTALDSVCAGSLFVQDGNYILAAAYTLGGIIIVVCILSSKSTKKWTVLETTATVLVMLCVLVWVYSGPKIATVVGSLALVIASIPQLVESWQKPNDTPVIVYGTYTAANTLAMFGGKSWTIEERFYPATVALLCLVITFFGSRKFFLFFQKGKPSL